jgi:hypothetical protein
VKELDEEAWRRWCTGMVRERRHDGQTWREEGEIILVSKDEGIDRRRWEDRDIAIEGQG